MLINMTIQYNGMQPFLINKSCAINLPEVVLFCRVRSYYEYFFILSMDQMITCATVVSHNDEPTENHLTLQLKICFRLFAFASLKICIVLLCLFVLCSAFACPCSSFYYWLSVFFVVVNSAVNIVTRVFNTLISIQSHSPKPVKKAGLRRSTRQVAAYTLTSDSLMAVRL